MLSIKLWRAKLKEALSVSSSTPELDAELLLMHILNCDRSHLYAHPERELSASQQMQLELLLTRRVQGEPIAYLTGSKEFWSLELKVTPHVLIPRPETELLVEHILALMPTSVIDIADLGTGSGAIALALASERPSWRIVATDKSLEALAIAKANAAHLKLTNVSFYQGDWTQALPPLLFNVIVSNPPYIAHDDSHISSNLLAYEPKAALLADDSGLSDLLQIIQDAKNFLKSGAYLFLEHGYNQAAAVASAMQKVGYTKIKNYSDLAGLPRITSAFWD